MRTEKEIREELKYWEGYKWQLSYMRNDSAIKLNGY